MTTTAASIDITEIAKSCPIDTLLSNVHLRSLRDSNGNLRDLTDAEAAFLKAARLELKRRGVL